MPTVEPDKKLERIRAVLPELRALVSSCRACGRACGADRAGGQAGVCRAGAEGLEHARWSAALPHFGEEPMLVGRGGSGTVFFSHCCLRCVFCQNWQISQGGEGRSGHFSELAEEFLSLQAQGVENINLVTPTQYILPAVLALEAAYSGGLRLPVVYNTNGYDSEELVRLLDHIVDVWLPDVKYTDTEPARCYSHAANYPETAKRAVLRMFRQSGPLLCKGEIAQSGVIIRHLVLPDNASGSFDFLLWLADEGMTGVTISLMSQYSPQHKAMEHPQIARSLHPKEYRDVVDFAEKLGFEHLLVQELDSREMCLPDFDRDKPFQEF